MQHSLLPSSANSDSCEDEDSDRSSEKEEQEDPTDYCKGRAEVVQQSTLSSVWSKLVLVPDPEPTLAPDHFQYCMQVILKAIYAPDSQKPTL